MATNTGVWRLAPLILHFLVAVDQNSDIGQRYASENRSIGLLANVKVVVAGAQYADELRRVQEQTSVFCLCRWI